MSINVTLKYYKGLAEDSKTHFFGHPVVNKKLLKKDLEKEDMFIGQINLEDVKPYDTENLLPSSGMIYIYYDIYSHSYQLFYYKEKGEILVEDFNTQFDFGRFDKPLAVAFENPETEEEKHAYGTKMLCDVPEAVKEKMPNLDEDYICFLVMCPPKLDYFEKQYLVMVKKYSCILIKKKDLKAKKFSKIISVNV